MNLFAGRLYFLVILLLSSFARVVSSEDAVEGSPPTAESNNSEDCAAEKSIKEMMCKLESVVSPGSLCSKQYDVDPVRPCIDLTSSQSIVTQLCDRISFLETKVNGLTAKVNLLLTRNPHNNNADDHNKPFTQIAKLREEIKQVKRSAAFYASRKDKIGNFTDEKILNYNASVNTGPYFDSANGIFIAPFDGIYHFTLSYQKPPEVSLEASLIVDHNIIASTSGEREPKIDLLTSLKSGSEVWTDITSNSTPTDSEVSIVFSGFLVH